VALPVPSRKKGRVLPRALPPLTVPPLPGANSTLATSNIPTDRPLSDLESAGPVAASRVTSDPSQLRQVRGQCFVHAVFTTASLSRPIVSQPPNPKWARKGASAVFEMEVFGPQWPKIAALLASVALSRRLGLDGNL